MKFENIVKSALVMGLLVGTVDANAAACNKDELAMGCKNLYSSYAKDDHSDAYFELKYTACGGEEVPEIPIGKPLCAAGKSKVSAWVWGGNDFMFKNKPIGKYGLNITCSGEIGGSPVCVAEVASSQK